MGEAVKPVMGELKEHETGQNQEEDHGHGRERLDPGSPLGVHQG